MHYYWPQGVLPLYGFLVMEGFVLLFMQPAAQGSLVDVVRAGMAAGEEGPGFTEGEVKRMGRKLLQGLDMMQRLGVVHRDIKVRRMCMHVCIASNWEKAARASSSPLSLITRTPHTTHHTRQPGNVFIDERGEPFIGDFGLASRVDADGRAFGFMGTPGYMSPEMRLQEGGAGFRGRTGVTIHSDLYAVGVVLQAMLDGSVVYSDELLDIVYRLTAEDPLARPKWGDEDVIRVFGWGFVVEAGSDDDEEDSSTAEAP